MYIWWYNLMLLTDKPSLTIRTVRHYVSEYQLILFLLPVFFEYVCRKYQMWWVNLNFSFDGQLQSTCFSVLRNGFRQYRSCDKVKFVKCNKEDQIILSRDFAVLPLKQLYLVSPQPFLKLPSCVKQWIPSLTSSMCHLSSQKGREVEIDIHPLHLATTTVLVRWVCGWESSKEGSM